MPHRRCRVSDAVAIVLAIHYLAAVALTVWLHRRLARENAYLLQVINDLFPAPGEPGNRSNDFPESLRRQLCLRAQRMCRSAPREVQS